MWDPHYMDYLERLGFQVIEPPPDLNDDSEEDEELQDGDDVGAADVDERPGTMSGHVMHDNYENGILPATAPSSPPEVVVTDDMPSEDRDDAVVEVESECKSQKKCVDGGKGGSTASLKGDDDEVMGEFNRGEIDGLFCPICYEAWSSGGDHNVCCLPCGHIYGFSCIKKWLGRQGSGKCPQCKKKCRIKDIRLLYATRVVAIDGDLQKRVQSFEAKCSSLEKKSADWAKKEVEWKKREADLHKQVQYLKERTHDLEDLLEDMERRASGSSTSNLNCPEDLTLRVDSNPSFHIGGPDKFKMQKNFQIQGARLFDIDSSSKILVFSRRLSGMGGAHVLTKVSLFSNHEREDIRLAENTKAVKDLQVSPHGGLVLLASLGKKLSVLSTQSNNTVITHNLPAAAWSCSWDICNSHYLYAGLQNGTVLQFDMRQTVKPVESLVGSTDKLVHTLHSLSSDSSCSSGVRSVLTASALGLCQFNFGGSEQRPCVIPESDKQGVCISLAYTNSSDYILASYRPKIEATHDAGVSQPMLTAAGQATMGSHVVYRKMGASATYQKLGTSCGNVNDIRVPIRSAIIDGVYENPVFASGDELTCEVIFQELPSQMVLERLKPQNYPIYDVRYSRVLSSGVLGCLSEDSFHLYSANLSST
ncbi:hypothetical protein C2S53_016782 [Perilla frutescens var. hirtella]|uniref:RING-type E3 ubiquitin transferase n=1 Tax=Perilla frutescens var. hirtella TaxID=608512 RepID=A0AAD4P486_PERFH|nr:hypothetical protein C2S53_016782 [Perilla frutescens var. hirtella]